MLTVHPVSASPHHVICCPQVLATQLLLDSVRGYNALTELAPLCPTFTAAEDAAAADLPALLSVQWHDCVPTLQPIPFDAGAVSPG